jgi:hypothetical protein
MFQRNILPPPSGLKIRQARNQHVAGAISQKMATLIPTAVKTIIPTLALKVFYGVTHCLQLLFIFLLYLFLGGEVVPHPSSLKSLNFLKCVLLLPSGEQDTTENLLFWDSQ